MVTTLGSRLTNRSTRCQIVTYLKASVKRHIKVCDGAYVAKALIRAIATWIY